MGKKKLKTKKWMQVLQFFAAYLVAAWTFIQFVDWVLNRYDISPYWVDILLWFFIGIIPSFLYYLYHKERINKKLLSTKEKIILPLNVLLLFVVLYFGFGTADLGATTKEISYTDAAGNLNTKVVTKSEFRAKIPIFNFSPISEDSTTAWLERGIRDLLYYDIHQDKNVEVLRFFADNTTDKVRGSELYYDFYIDGSYEYTDGLYSITPTIRQANNGQLITDKTFKGTDLLKTLDSISLFVREYVSIDDLSQSQYINLELKEFMSSSLEAIKQFTLGNNEKAIELDSTFAYSYLNLANYNINYSKGKIEEQHNIDQAYRYSDKLPFDRQLQVLINKHIAYDYWKEAEELVKLQLEIEPNNETYINRLYTIFAETKQVKAFLEHTKKRFDAEESQRNVGWYGKALLVNGEYNTYKDYVTNFMKKFPKNDDVFYYNLVPELLSGDIKEARKTLNKAFILHPDWDNFTKPLDSTITYLEQHPIKNIDLSPFIGEFRSYRNEQVYHYWFEGNQLLFHASNQIISNLIPHNSNTIISTFNRIGGLLKITQIKDKNDKPYLLKFQQYNNENSWFYYGWKIDELIKNAEHLLHAGDIEAAEIAYLEAIAANPNHYYLKDALAYIKHIKNLGTDTLQQQFEDVVGIYRFEGEDRKELNRRIWIEKGKLMYKLEGSTRSRIELLPISEHVYINHTNLTQRYEFEYKDGQVVGCFNWFFDMESRTWKTVDTNYATKD